MHVLLIQNCALEGFGHYRKHLESRNVGLSIAHPYSGDVLPDPREIDAFIVGGTPICALDNGPAFLNRERAYLAAVLQTGKPYLGICFGAQLLARLVGGSVVRGGNVEIGGYAVTLTTEGLTDPVFAGFPSRFPVFQWHSDTFIPPSAGSTLAVGDDGTPQAFRIGNAVGLQFHLEVSGADASLWCREYAKELEMVGKTEAAVVEECRQREEWMAQLAGLLLENSLGPAS